MRVKEKLNKLFGRLTGYRLYHKKMWRRVHMIRANARRLIYFTRHFEQIRGIPGAVVECGVYQGRSLLLLAYLAEEENRNVYGFDSFSGFK